MTIDAPEVPAGTFRVGSSRPKNNTCKPRSRARLERAAAGIERHIANNPHDSEARKRLDNLRTRIGEL